MTAKDNHDAQPIRLEVEFKAASGGTLTAYYALDARTYRQQKSPTAQDLYFWLKDHGGRLDRADGPAVVVSRPDGSRSEYWFRNGQLVKEETLANPATIPVVTILPPRP